MTKMRQNVKFLFRCKLIIDLTSNKVCEKTLLLEQHVQAGNHHLLYWFSIGCMSREPVRFISFKFLGFRKNFPENPGFCI